MLHPNKEGGVMVKLNTPQFASMVLTELGIDPLYGEYTYTDGDLSVPGKTDEEILQAEKRVFPKALEHARERAKEKAREYADSIGKQLTKQYPEAEISSWPVKIAAAEAYMAGTASQRQKDMIDTEATIVGIPSVDLANTIVTKAAFFEKAAAMIAGMRQKTYAAIDAAQSQQEIDTILQQAKAEADQLLNDILAQMP